MKRAVCVETTRCRVLLRCGFQGSDRTSGDTGLEWLRCFNISFTRAFVESFENGFACVLTETVRPGAS